MKYWTYNTSYSDLEIVNIYRHGTSINKGYKKTGRS